MNKKIVKPFLGLEKIPSFDEMIMVHNYSHQEASRKQIFTFHEYTFNTFFLVKMQEPLEKNDIPLSLNTQTIHQSVSIYDKSHFTENDLSSRLLLKKRMRANLTLYHLAIYLNYQKGCHMSILYVFASPQKLGCNLFFLINSKLDPTYKNQITIENWD